MRSLVFFNKVTVLGVGLIGASFALALRKNNLCTTIHGFGRNEAGLKKAKQKGIIDDYSLDAAKACFEADLIFLSTPVGAFRDITAQIKNSFKPGALVTDAGSVKGSLVLELEAMMPVEISYIGSHPIAGSEKSGIDDARSDLFSSAKCIITPTDRSAEDAVHKISAVWKAVGGKVEFMDPFRHDEIYGAVSHLPHIVAFALVNAVSDISSNWIEYAGQGFKDTTRIAMSSPELWRDIAIFNKENISRMIEVYKGSLDRIKNCLDKNDISGIEEFLSKAREIRERLDS